MSMWRWRLARQPGPRSTDHVGALVADEVAAARAVGRRVAARAAEDGEGQSHATALTSSSSGPSSWRPSRRNTSTSPEDSKRWRPGPAVGRSGQVELAEQGPHPERGLVGRVDQHDVAAHDVADRAGEERVVGAAEQQGVDGGVDQRGEQPLGEHVDLVGVGLAPLDELDEAGAGGTGQLHAGVGLGHGLLVGARADGADGADDADVAVAGGAAPASARPARSPRRPAPARARWSSPSAAADAVLQATTTSFTSWLGQQVLGDLVGEARAPRRAAGGRRGSGRCRRRRRGPRRAAGRSAARATVSPPNPLSNIPMGRGSTLRGYPCGDGSPGSADGAQK